MVPTCTDPRKQSPQTTFVSIDAMNDHSTAGLRLRTLLVVLVIQAISGCSSSSSNSIASEAEAPPAKVYTNADYQAYRDDPRTSSLCLNATRGLVEGGLLMADIPEGILEQRRLIKDPTPSDHQFAYRAGCKKVYLSSWIKNLSPYVINSQRQVNEHLETVESINTALEHLDVAYKAGEKTSVIDRQFLLFTESWDRVLSRVKTYSDALSRKTNSLVEAESDFEKLPETLAAANKLSESIASILAEAKSTRSQYQSLLDADDWVAMNVALVFELTQANDATNPMKDWSGEQKFSLIEKLLDAGDPAAAGMAAAAAVELLHNDSGLSNDEKEKRELAVAKICEKAKAKGHGTAHFATAKLLLGANDQLALTELQKASDMGHAYAAMTLGGFYGRGEHVAMSFERAMKHYRRALDLGWNSAAQKFGGSLFLIGRRDELIEFCQHDAMQSRPDRIYGIAETSFEHDPRFSRELMVIAREAGIANGDQDFARKAAAWLENTKPSVVRAKLLKELAANQAESDAHEERLRMLRIEQEVDAQMEYNIWRAKQR